MLEDYKDHVKTLSCLISGQGGVDRHHLKAVGMGRRRPLPRWEDYLMIPLKRRYHQELHQIGINEFEEKYGINLWYEALLILAQWLFKREFPNPIMFYNEGKRCEEN